MNPLVSIIIPNYNREYLISETLDSIIAQTYKNWECIVVDDHSTDSSWSIVADFCKLDKRIRQVKRPDKLLKGACSCRNYGFTLSKGAYINWFDSDDIMAANKLELQVLELIHNSADLSICQTQFFEGGIHNLKKYWNSHFTGTFNSLTDFITFRLAWSTNAPLWRKSFLEKKELFNVFLSSSQDWEFHVRLLCDHPKKKVLNDVLVFNRIHDSRIGVKKNSTRKGVRFNSRVLAINEISKRQLMNVEIKKYFNSFFMNQLKQINTFTPIQFKELVSIIKQNTKKVNWYFNIYPRIVMYFLVFKMVGKRLFAYKLLIQQVINDNRK